MHDMLPQSGRGILSTYFALKHPVAAFQGSALHCQCNYCNHCLPHLPVSQNLVTNIVVFGQLKEVTG